MEQQIRLKPTDFVSGEEFIPPKTADGSNHVLVTLHGIHDTGAWGSVIKEIPSAPGVKIKIQTITYDYLDCVRFIFRYGHERRSRYVIDRLQQIRLKNAGVPISIIAHSNGTKILSEIIDKVDFDFDFIFLCSSVCRVSDSLALVRANRDIVADCGTRDIWPLIATALNPRRFGPTGRLGFGNDPIIDRFFWGYAHGRTVSLEHIEQWVLPTIRDGRVVETKKYVGRYAKHVPGLIWAVVAVVVMSVFLLL